MEKIGLIAGNRKFPVIFSQAAKKQGLSIIAVAIRGDTSFKLSRHVDKIHWLGLGDFKKMFEIFKREGIKRVAMAGQISPKRLFSKEVYCNQELRSILDSIKDKKADTIFGAVAGRIKEAGFELIDSTTYLKEFLPPKGNLTKNTPDFKDWESIYFGLELAKQIAYLDIGQTVAVKDKAIVAVEALEGTDNLIRRASQLCRGSFILIKVSKPKQDMRFDIPVVGLNTVKNLVKAKASCLAIEADKTLFIDKEESLILAERKGLSVVSV
jgi:DUF1009 family protein